MDMPHEVNVNNIIRGPFPFPIFNNIDHYNRAVSVSDMDLSAAYNDRNDLVMPIHKCETSKAKKLCIYDLAKKLKRSNDYDIGGTYAKGVSEFWFLYKTSYCPGNNYLLNLYVCHRTRGNFSIGVSNSNQVMHKKVSDEHTGFSTLYDKLTWYSFKSVSKDNLYYIKTFCFSDKDIKALENRTLCVPIQIKTNVTNTVSDEVVTRIKMNHDFCGLQSKQDHTDFKLETPSGKVFNIHKIILAAHSPVLRELVKDPTASSAKIDNITDANMDLLIQFLYTGNIENIMKVDCSKLINIASRFKLRNMFVLTQHVIGKQINVDNALEIAQMSEEYDLENLQNQVFRFIYDNPKVLESDAWKTLNNIELTKKMLKFFHFQH